MSAAASPAAPSPDGRPPEYLGDAAVRSIIIGLMLAILLGALDQTIVSVALARMAEDLHGFELLAWVVSSYLVASTVVTPIYGKLGDLFGRRLMLSCALCVFLLASVGCALAQTMGQMIAARVIQGLGGGGLISIAQTIIADVVPLRERGRYQGYISGVFALSSVTGPVVGGLLTHYLSWRWCFWINLPLGLAALLISRRALALLPVPGVRRPIDYLGAVLLTTALTTLLIGITRTGHGDAWNSSAILELYGTAIVFATLFVIWEKRAREPLVPLHLFRNRAVTLCCVILFLGFFNLIGMAVLMPLRFQIVAEAPANVAAWRLVPMSLMIPCGAFVAGRLMMKSGRYRPTQLVGAALVPIMLAALAWVDVRSVWPCALIMAGAGIAIGLQFPSALVAVQNSVPYEHLGIATATTAFSRSLGGAIGIALLSSVLLATLHANAGSAYGGVNTLHDMLTEIASGSAATRAELHATTDAAFGHIFLVGAAIALIAPVLAWFVPDRALRGRAG